MFESKNQEKNIFDEMIVTIGTTFYDLQLMLAHFVCEILEIFEDAKVEVSLKFPFFNGEEYLTYFSEEIYFDIDKDLVMIKLQDVENSIEWSMLDAHTMERFASEIHMKFEAYKQYLAFSGISIESKMH